MREIIRKIGSFFEEHVEKVVLGVAAVACLVVLFLFVIQSPNKVSYDGDKYSPGEIDDRIYQQTQVLQETLRQEPEASERYIARLNGHVDPNDPVREGVWGDLSQGFSGLLASAISGIDTNVVLPIPPNSSAEVGVKRAYKLPSAGQVQDVAVEHIRSVAYVPTVQITDQAQYQESALEPNDIDLVTVEAKIDVAELYRKFHESFAGINVKEEWRDPCLAEPVFAAVELQRQEMVEDGTWSDWKRVPRLAIDQRRSMFEIIEDEENLPPGGIKVRLLRFRDPVVRMDLLQPQAYQIASAREEWFPPILHREFLEQQRREELEEKREARDAEKEEEEREREDRRNERRGMMMGGRTTGAGRGGTGGYYDGEMGGVYGYGERDRRSSSRTRRTPADSRTTRGALPEGRSGRERTATRRGRGERDADMDYLTRGGEIADRISPVDEVYNKYNDILLAYTTDLSKMEEPLVFWAHDDTVEPGGSYRYRIRLGVFNPVAGTNQLESQDKSLKDQVILWTNFSETTKTVNIPERLYFFAKSLQEAAKTITVEVARYVMGYWYSENFAVKPGEVIGKVVENEELEKLRESLTARGYLGRSSYGDRIPLGSTMVTDVGALSGTVGQQVTMPETIDYTTGAVVIDSAPVSDWIARGRTLQPRMYYEMLYSSDGTNIERTPIESRYWPTKLLAMFNDIKKAQREPKEPLKALDSGRQRGRGTRMLEGYGGREGYEYDQMMPMGRGRY